MQRDQKLQSLQEQFDIAMKWHNLEENQILNSAQDAYLTDLQRITSKYAFEREQIALTYQYDDQMRNALIGASYQTEEIENDKSKRGAWNQYQGAIGIDTGAEDERTRREEAIQAAWEWQLITQEERQQQLLESERAYHSARSMLALSYAEQIAGGTADSFRTMFGEQSAAYRIMFGIQKGFAIAQSVIAIQQGIANAMALPFPANLGAAATVAMETASIVSNIQAVTMPDGMAHDGIAEIPTEGTWLLNKGERVLNPQDNKAFTNFINEKGQQQQAPNITINNAPPGTTARQESDGSITIDIVRQEIDRSWNNLSRPNSKESKAVSRNTTATPRR